MSYRVCFVVGARPNFMKTAPVFRALANGYDGVEPLLVHTGQHYDEEMSTVFLEELELPQPDVFLGVGSGSHAQQTARALVGMERALLEHRSSLCVVAGDVNSTLAGALAASKLRIPIAHIEAGLRSFDESMPEEANRRLTDHLSRLLLAHSDDAVENLTREGIDASRIHLVGNTMIDSVLHHLPRALDQEPWSRFGIEPGDFALVTLHRPALVDNTKLLRRTVDALEDLAEDLPIIFPMHPRTKARLAARRSAAKNPRLDNGLILCSPLGYLDFLGLEAKASFVVTDSGGVQEETSALGVRCFTYRDSTERPVTVELGTNLILGSDPEKIRTIPTLLQEELIRQEIPLWDGMASNRAAALLSSFLADDSGVDDPPRATEGRR